MNAQDFQKNSFQDLQVLVIGDAMIDRYYYGRIERMSPEAEVPIVDIDKIENRLGGAANVALNISSLGAKAHLMTIVGNDEEALLFKQLLNEAGICNNLVEANRRTTIKTRIYENNKYVLRYDIEDTYDLEEEAINKLLANIKLAMEKVPLGAIVLQDYNKGVLTERTIEAIISYAKDNNIPVAVDPKEKYFFEYQQVDLFKPNLKEVNKALNADVKGDDEIGLKKLCGKLKDSIAAKSILLTLAQHGAVALDEVGFYKVEAHEREVVDVSGAGDTVIAMASLLLALEFSTNKIMFYSNLAGGLVIEERGVKALDLALWESTLGL